MATEPPVTPNQEHLESDLTEEQRNWLQEAISLVQPGHPWLTQLSH